MLNDDHSALPEGSGTVVDAMVKNLLIVTSQSGNEQDVRKHSEALSNLVPYVNRDYIAEQLAKMSGFNEKKIENISSEKSVQSYVYSLLEENHANTLESASYQKHKGCSSKSSFKMDSLTTAINNLRKKDSYSDEMSSPNMVIHVCDEAKNLKQDFDCPRDLLIQEMRYFAEYLSVDAQRLEEVDISVHCDIHIFDWLMRYVKRRTKLIDEGDIPRLDPNNVISILISSDFLKMETLVETCISYCHKNMSAIVSTPCNMNCVNDKLTAMIAQKFTHSELEDVKDRKDKFKSKLFCKKIEKLFDSDNRNPDSPGKASSLFKCSICQRFLTWELNCKLPCTNNRLSVGSTGGLSYEHEADASWDVNSYLISMYDELHKWNLVYWKLWGIINYLNCSRCGQTFQICDFGNCLHHPERAQYHPLGTGDSKDNPVGIYPCCNQHVLRFDPTGINKGCRAKDHSVLPTDSEQRRKLEDFMNHKSLIKSTIPVCATSSDLNIFASEEARCSIKEATMTPVEIPSVVLPIPSAARTATSGKGKLKKGIHSSDNDEEDVAGEEDAPPFKKNSSSFLLSSPAQSQHSFLTVSASNSSIGNDSSRSHTLSKKKEKIQIPSDNTTYKRFPSKQRWDSARSIRWNQDVQREEDRRRLTSMASNLTKQRTIEKSDRAKVKDPKDLSGGIFMKLEIAFFNNLKGQGNNQIQNLSRQYGGGKDFKLKSRR